MEDLAATLKYLRFTDFIIRGLNTLCHNFSQRRSERRDTRFPDLSSVKIIIFLISHAERVLKWTLGQDLLASLKLVLANNPLQETFP